MDHQKWILISTQFCSDYFQPVHWWFEKQAKNINRAYVGHNIVYTFDQGQKIIFSEIQSIGLVIFLVQKLELTTL